MLNLFKILLNYSEMMDSDNDTTVPSADAGMTFLEMLFSKLLYLQK